MESHSSYKISGKTDEVHRKISVRIRQNIDFELSKHWYWILASDSLYSNYWKYIDILVTYRKQPTSGWCQLRLCKIIDFQLSKYWYWLLTGFSLSIGIIIDYWPTQTSLIFQNFCSLPRNFGEKVPFSLKNSLGVLKNQFGVAFSRQTLTHWVLHSRFRISGRFVWKVAGK